MFDSLFKWLGGLFSSDSDADAVSTECETLPCIRYVTNADGKGWLTVRHDNPSVPGQDTYPPLPQHLKVEVYKIEGGREYFKILEGQLKGTTASVKLKADGGSYLSKINPHLGPAQVIFNRKTGVVEVGGVRFQAITDPNNPVPLGKWKLALPDEVHPLGASYTGDSVFAETWFRIASEGQDGVSDRFLHPGRISAGCTTVTDTKLWTSLYNVLIKSRHGDDLHIGTLEVVE